jgi:hypothetical protein
LTAPAPSRFWRIGFQYRSSAPHAGFQYCAVDSITTSSTSCSSSHSADRSQLFGVAAKPPPLKPILAVDFHVGRDHGQHLLVDIDSRYSVRHKFLLAGAESVPQLP